MAGYFNNFIFLLIQLLPQDKNWSLHLNPSYDNCVSQPVGRGSRSDLRLTKAHEEMLKSEKHTRFHSHPATSSRGLVIPFTLPPAISVA